MNKNLNNHSKAELIRLINKQENNLVNSENELNKKQINSKESSITIWDIIHKFKIWILSLTAIAVLGKIFKNYKSIRAVLKVANYVILTMFGISIFEAFGFGFIVKLLGELKYIFGGIVAYLTDSTFYNYLVNLFNVADENQSVRNAYKKPVETDWKLEYEKAEKRREWEKWLEKHPKKEQVDEQLDSKLIILTLLFLGGSIAIWYYGKDALDLVSQGWNISELIKRFLRGGNNNDDGNNGGTGIDFNSIELDDRAISPDMLTYSSDVIEQKNIDSRNQHKFVNPEPPNAPPIPSTEHGNLENIKSNKPSSLLESIKQGRKLKSVETTVKDNTPKGEIFIPKTDQESNIVKDDSSNIVEDNAIASSSKIESTPKRNLLDALSHKFNKINKVVDEETNISDDWEDNSKTPTGELVESPRSDKAVLGITENKKGKNKFLEAITYEEKTPITSTPISSRISDELKSIQKKFPNISKNTLEKLNTVEGIKNREEIINSIPDSELTIEDKTNKIIKETMQKDSQTVFEKLQEIMPEYTGEKYKENFMKAIEKEINTGKTDEEKEKIRKSFLDYDLIEMQQTGIKPDSRSIKNVMRENYTHYNLMNEIKRKSSTISNKKELSSTEQLDDTMNLFD